MDYGTPPITTGQGSENTDINTSSVIAAVAAATSDQTATQNALSSFYEPHQLGPIRHNHNNHVHQHHPYEQQISCPSNLPQQQTDEHDFYGSLAAAAALASGVPPPSSSMYYYDPNQQWQNNSWNNAFAVAAQYAQFPHQQQLPLSSPSLPLTNGFQNFGKINNP